jgi:Nucleotide-diphospho-sugar transferase.
MARRKPTDVRTATIASYGALVCSLCLYVASLSPLASETLSDIRPKVVVSVPSRPSSVATAVVKNTASSSAAVQEAFEFDGAPRWDTWWTPAARTDLLRIANRTSHLQHSFRASGSHGVLVVSLANFEYRAVLLNWLHALARLRIHNYFLVSLDRDIGGFLQSLGVASVFDLWRGQQPPASSYGSRAVRPLSLRAVWKLRTEVLAALLHGGYSVVLSDIDAVWLKDPSPWLSHGIGDVVARCVRRRRTSDP